MLIQHRPVIFPRRIRILAAIKDMEEKGKKKQRRRSRIGERFDNGEMKERKRERKRKNGDGVG